MSNIFTYSRDIGKQEVEIQKLNIRVTALEDKLEIYENYLFQLINGEAGKSLLDKIVAQAKDRLNLG